MKKFLFFLLLISYNIYSQTTKTDVFSKDFEKKEGFVDFYWNESKGKVYLNIKDLNQEFLYVNYLSAGVGSNDIGLDRGQIGGTKIISFVKMGSKIVMIQPNYKFRAITNNLDEKKSVDDAFASSAIWGFDVVASKEDSYMIDITEFLLRDSHGIINRLKRQKQETYGIILFEGIQCS
jgi:hypothetical protein